LISEESISHEMGRLRRSDSHAGNSLSVNSLSTVGLRVANAFHPQMWHVPAKAGLRSPAEYFDDDAFLMRVLERTPRFWPNRSSWNAQCIRSGFRIMSQGRVANFRPVIARRIIKEFCRSNGTVLDFSAGYGGRLLGALSLPVHYIGIDPCSLQVLGLTRLTETVGTITGTAEIIAGGAEDELPRFRSSSIDLVFSSPPYFKHEQYSSESTQSAVRFPTYVEWRDRFLNHMIWESKRVLKRGGTLVLNIANIRGYNIADDAKQELLRTFGNLRVSQMPMGRVPSHRNEYPWLRFEPLFICRKP
jgi:hypothetical protein